MSSERPGAAPGGAAERKATAMCPGTGGRGQGLLVHFTACTFLSPGCACPGHLEQSAPAPLGEHAFLVWGSTGLFKGPLFPPRGRLGAGRPGSHPALSSTQPLQVALMATVFFLSVLLSVLLSFRVAWADSGWVMAPRGMDHVCHITQNYANGDICRPVLKVNFGRIMPDFSGAKITECSVASINIALKPKIGVHVFTCIDVHLELGPFVYLRVAVTFRVAYHTGRHGLYVHGCAVVDAVIKGRSVLTTDAATHQGLEALVRVLTGPLCDRGRVWCRDLNYCFFIDQEPFPITPSCYGIWRNQPPRITESQIELRSQPVCTCKEMDDGISVTIDSIVALKTTMSPEHQSIYFCHEKDATYLFECMRKGRVFNDQYTSVSLSVGRVQERLPNLSFSCPKTSNIVMKIECTRIFVDMQLGHALLCYRLRVNIGCDLLNFTSSTTFIAMGCLNLFFHVDCRRELLLLSVATRGPLRIRRRCTEGEECETDETALSEIFQQSLMVWSRSYLNAKMKNGFRIPFLKHYPCDSCQQTIYAQRRVYCPCTLSFVPK
ncbi:uncharacterized protein LOC143836603 [Paroedura picta]|uniref:uncharacterized protein LOC143836603 n=1 Tax=Paroedura picta TaxID=143630 RepID=UPI00405795C6